MVVIIRKSRKTQVVFSCIGYKDCVIYFDFLLRKSNVILKIKVTSKRSNDAK